MKKAYFLSVLIWCLLVLAACGKTDEEPHYHEIGVKIGQLEEAENEQFLMGRQYYQGEPVSILAERSAAEGAFLKNTVPGGWFLDHKGHCFIIGAKGLTRLDADGKLLYHSRT